MPRHTIRTPGASVFTQLTSNRNDGVETANSFVVPTNSSDNYMPPFRERGSVRFDPNQQFQTPHILPGTTSRAQHRSDETAKDNSDNDSEHGSNTSNTSRHDQTEARKTFRHVLQAPNPEKFAGDKKMYHLWKTALQSEVEHIEMTPDMWLNLLQTRTK